MRSRARARPLGMPLNGAPQERRPTGATGRPGSPTLPKQSPESVEFHPLPASFYMPSAKVVAPRLLGHVLIRNTPQGPSGGMIIETEAYLANDPACHGYRRETPRNRSMYGPPGRAYVYFIYGNYFCFNAVCGPPGLAEAVLVRAIAPRFGVDWMRANRPVSLLSDLTSGPAKFCLALAIKRELDGVNLCDPASPLFIAANPDVRTFRRQNGPVITTTRVGLSTAEDWLLRYYLDGSEFVSKRGRAAAPRRRAG
jgi:DNA-3-methyladenine glycosylase